MIWTKTEAGRAEMQARSRVKERAQRNLLLLIDGQKSEQTLLAQVAGVAPGDFTALQALGLIEPAPAGRSRAVAGDAPTVPAPLTAPAPLTEPAALTQPMPLTQPAPLDVELPAAPLDYAGFTEALTRLISQQLGLRGFTLTLAVEKAATIEELKAVARRVIEQIGERKGAPAAEQARRTLFGG